MTKLIGVLVVALLVWGGYALFGVWDKYDKQKDVSEQEAAQKEAARHITGDQLGGLTDQLQKSYDIASQNGATGIRNWLKAYGSKVEDPRRAWIELDYVVAVAREDPNEAKKVFAEVKARTPQDSRVYPRIQELSKTYQ